MHYALLRKPIWLQRLVPQDVLLLKPKACCCPCLHSSASQGMTLKWLEVKHPKAGVEMSQPGVWLHHANFSACFPDFAATLIIKEVKENPSKPENTFGFLFKQMIVTPFLFY